MTTDTIKALRDALEQIKAGLSEKGPRVIAAEVLALTADASEDAPRQITYCEEEWITKTDWVQTDFQKDLFPLAYLGQHRADIMRDEIARLRRVIAHSAPVAATPAPDELLSIGATMGNVMYNLAQRQGYVLTDADCEMYSDLRKKWDAARRAAASAAPIAEVAAMPRLYRFDRLRNGVVMAEGIGVHAVSMVDAEHRAKTMAHQGDKIKFRDNEPCHPARKCGMCKAYAAEHAKPEPVKFCECTQQQRARCDFCAGFGQQAGAVDGEASCR